MPKATKLTEPMGPKYAITEASNSGKGDVFSVKKGGPGGGTRIATPAAAKAVSTKDG